jgi:hypothetical protein
MIITISGRIGSGKDITGQIIQHLIAWKKTPIKENYIDDVLLSLNNSVNNTNNGWEIKKFADKLKDIVCLLIGCTREQLEDREFRDIPLGEEWNKWKVQESKGKISWKELYFSTKEEAINYIKKYHRFQQESELIKLTPRTLLQLLGTEAGRNIIHPDIWVNSLFSEYKVGKITDKPTYHQINKDRWIEYPNWIITDNRFPNETKRVKKEGGLTIKIERDFNLRHPGYNNLEEVKQKDIELYKQLTHFSETALDDYTDWDHIIQNNGSLEDLIESVKQILIEEGII